MRGYPLSPDQVRQTYLETKHIFDNHTVFIRVGDFYETYDEDARVVDSVLDFGTVTRVFGKEKIITTGIPYYNAHPHLEKLKDAGLRVLLWENMSGVL